MAMNPEEAMPSLTVRSMAEMLNLPAHAQARILSEQKHPKQAPQVFRTPYYQQALAGIRQYYKAGRDHSKLTLAALKCEEFEQESKRDHNLRVLNSFKASELAARDLLLTAKNLTKLALNNVELRLMPDLAATEGGKPRIVFLNFRGHALDPEVARLTLEIADWVFEKNQIPIGTKNLEYVDLFKGKAYAIAKRRASTIKAVTQNFKIIEALWPTL
jgi:hypothetical protein